MNERQRVLHSSLITHHSSLLEKPCPTFTSTYVSAWRSGLRDVVAVVFDAVAGSRAFSAGVSVEEHQPETVYQMLESFHNVFRTLDQMGKPALALVDGAALGGGCELVAGCDVVLAASHAKFGQPEIKLG